MFVGDDCGVSDVVGMTRDSGFVGGDGGNACGGSDGDDGDYGGIGGSCDKGNNGGRGDDTCDYGCDVLFCG